jgi:predicted DNA-binding ArsR family transcriptional regulator
VDQVIEARKETIRRLLNQKAAFNRMIKIENFNRTLIEVVTKENRKLSIKELKKKILKLEKIMETIAYY